jgi:hypothetical protein
VAADAAHGFCKDWRAVTEPPWSPSRHLAVLQDGHSPGAAFYLEWAQAQAYDRPTNFEHLFETRLAAPRAASTDARARYAALPIRTPTPTQTYLPIHPVRSSLLLGAVPLK